MIVTKRRNRVAAKNRPKPERGEYEVRSDAAIIGWRQAGQKPEREEV
jgi:hypothetical protein